MTRWFVTDEDRENVDEFATEAEARQEAMDQTGARRATSRGYYRTPVSQITETDDYVSFREVYVIQEGERGWEDLWEGN